MSASDYLRSRYNACETRISELEARKKVIAEAKESLALYKSDVSGADGTFRSAIEGREKLLADLSNIVNCRPAEKYQEGMNNTLSGIGSNVVLLVFKWMRLHVTIQDKAYDAELTQINAEIRLKRLRMEELQLEISAAEALSI